MQANWEGLSKANASRISHDHYKKYVLELYQLIWDFFEI